MGRRNLVFFTAMVGIETLIGRASLCVVLALGVPAVQLAGANGAELNLSTAPPPALVPTTEDPFLRGKAAYESRDYPDAMHWFRIAADAGKGAGMAGMGVLYGLALGVPANDREAIRWFKSAAEKDTAWAPDVRAMMAAVDPHTGYLTEREYHEMGVAMQGEFAGLGLEITMADGRPRVVSPIDDTPAARAGFKAGDVILDIDGASVDGLSLQDVITRLRGDAGSTVRLTISRADQEAFDVTLTRAMIRVTAVKSHLEFGHIGYLRITVFSEQAQPMTLAALTHLTQDVGGRLDGLVLDLRNNPGGLLAQSIAVAGDFLDGGRIVSTVGWRGRGSAGNRTFSAPDRGDQVRGIPIIVLINGASASAAEIVAGALQDRRRARVLGTRSFGKGTVQNIFPLSGHGALRLTIAEYQLPSGRSIQARGVAPDELVLPGPDAAHDRLIHREADLLRREAPDAPDPQVDADALGTPRDHQLAVALQELGGAPVASHP